MTRASLNVVPMSLMLLLLLVVVVIDVVRTCQSEVENRENARQRRERKKTDRQTDILLTISTRKRKLMHKRTLRKP